MGLARLCRHPERKVDRTLFSLQGILIGFLNLLNRLRKKNTERFRDLIPLNATEDQLHHTMARVLLLWFCEPRSPSRGTSIVHRSPFIRTLLTVFRMAIREGVFVKIPLGILYIHFLPSSSIGKKRGGSGSLKYFYVGFV